jgi:hypothetical protein
VLNPDVMTVSSLNVALNVNVSVSVVKLVALAVR